MFMKKLLGIVVLGLLLSGNVYADQIGFLCKSNIDSGKYPLVIDIDKKKMFRIGTEYEIVHINEGYITGRVILNESTGRNISIVLNRYSGELHVNFYKTKSATSKDYSNSYETKCTKAKKLI